LHLPFVALQKSAGVSELDLSNGTVRRTLLFPPQCGDVSTLTVSSRRKALFVGCRSFEQDDQGAILRIQDATISIILTRGKKPRSFTLLRDQFLLCANQISGSRSMISIDAPWSTTI